MAVRRLHPDQPPSFAFSPENLAWIKETIAKYPPGKQASAVIPVLWRAQEQHNGWLPEPAIRAVADLLGMAYIRVYEVATFYTMFQLAPVGSVAHVQVCGTTPCMLRGSADLIEACKRRIHPEPHHLSADGRFSWEEVECLGSCANAPMVQIFKDTYEDLTPELLERVIDGFAKGTPPKPGSQTGRTASCPSSGQTSLKDPSLYDGSRVGAWQKRFADAAAAAPAAPPAPAPAPAPSPAAAAPAAAAPAVAAPAAPAAQSAIAPASAAATPAAAAGKSGSDAMAIAAKVATTAAGLTGAGAVAGAPAAASVQHSASGIAEAAAAAATAKAATGGTTAPAAAAAPASSAAPKAAAASAPAPAAATSAPPPAAATSAAAPAATTAPSAAAAAEPKPRKPVLLTAARDGGKGDDLGLIWGVGDKLHEKLNAMGIWHFDQIAAWTPAEVAWFEGEMQGFKGRVERDKWIEQCKKLSTGWRPDNAAGERPKG
jgi:NADH-quinone oxidoreductase subunit E